MTLTNYVSSVLSSTKKAQKWLLAAVAAAGLSSSAPAQEAPLPVQDTPQTAHIVQQDTSAESGLEFSLNYGFFDTKGFEPVDYEKEEHNAYRRTATQVSSNGIQIVAKDYFSVYLDVHNMTWGDERELYSALSGLTTTSSRLKEEMKFEEFLARGGALSNMQKARLLATIASAANDQYGSKGKELSGREMYGALLQPQKIELGICGGIHAAVAQMAEAMHFGTPALVAGQTEDGGEHIMMIDVDRDAETNEQEAYILDYGDLWASSSDILALLAARDRAFGHVTGNRKFYDSKGKSVCILPTQDGLLIRDMTGQQKYEEDTEALIEGRWDAGESGLQANALWSDQRRRIELGYKAALGKGISIIPRVSIWEGQGIETALKNARGITIGTNAAYDHEDGLAFGAIQADISVIKLTKKSGEENDGEWTAPIHIGMLHGLGSGRNKNAPADEVTHEVRGYTLLDAVIEGAPATFPAKGRDPAGIFAVKAGFGACYLVGTETLKAMVSTQALWNGDIHPIKHTPTAMLGDLTTTLTLEAQGDNASCRAAAYVGMGNSYEWFGVDVDAMLYERALDAQLVLGAQYREERPTGLAERLGLPESRSIGVYLGAGLPYGINVRASGEQTNYRSGPAGDTRRKVTSAMLTLEKRF